MFFRITCAVIAAVLSVSAASEAKDVEVQGYTRKDGTYVAPYMRSAPDSTRDNNFSTRGNINPYTGQEGTKPPDSGFGYAAPYSPPRSYEAPAPQPYYNPAPFGSPPPVPPPTNPFSYTPYGQ